MPPPLQVNLIPTIDLDNGVGVTCDVGFICANLSLPMPLLLISTTATLYIYICQNVDIIPVSSFNVNYCWFSPQK